VQVVYIKIKELSMFTVYIYSQHVKLNFIYTSSATANIISQ